MIRTDRHGFFIKANELKGTTLFLDEPSVTATENAIMASIFATGSTSIKNAASEPHVQDLIGFLNKLGACISGSESNILEIKCTRELEGGSWKVIGDHIEVGSFISLAAVTGSEIVIKDAGPGHLDMIEYYFSKLGVKIIIKGDDVLVPGTRLGPGARSGQALRLRWRRAPRAGQARSRRGDDRLR